MYMILSPEHRSSIVSVKKNINEDDEYDYKEVIFKTKTSSQ